MKLPIETQLKLRKFVPRKYQWPLIDGIEKEGYKRVLAIMPRRCIDGDSHILMSDGSPTYLKDIKVGDNILSWDGNSFVPDRVKHIWKTEKKESIDVKTPIMTVTCSENHVFAHSSGTANKVNWSPINAINEHGNLLHYAGTESTIHTPELAAFWGYMLSDGYVSGEQQPKFTNTNMVILKRVEELALKLFDVVSIWRPKGNGFDVGFSNGTKGGGTFINPIKELFRKENVNIPKYKRRLPKSLWNLDRESLLYFFSGIISGDGSIATSRVFTPKGTKKVIPAGVEISIHCGKSKDYAWDMYWLLRKIGITPQKLVLEKESNWKIRIGKQEHIKILLSKRIYGKEEAQKRALDTIKDQSLSRTVFKGCYRGRFKISQNTPRELYDIETEINHNFIANGYVVHNSGKDLTAFNICIRQCLSKICVVYYIFPTFAQAKRVIWDSITGDGDRFLDYIPSELILSQNSQEMKIRFVNGSLLQLVGSDNYNALMGTNPYGVVFSEYSLQDPRAWQYIRPILAQNDGWALFISTPRGRSNHLYPLYEMARESPSWKCIKLTLHDTQHISDEAMEIERREMSDDMVLQEYYTSFDAGIEGAYYAKYVDKMRVEGRVTDVPWEAGFPVHTAWDLGVRDSTVIIFFQAIGTSVRIIDVYENSKVGLEHYSKVLQSKDYTYGRHIAPHDIKVKELGTGMTRLEKARQLGIKFIVAQNISIVDGIESVRSTLGKIWIDQVKCKKLISALENYRQDYDTKNRIYRSHAKHDWSSHWADAIRYLCLGLPRCKAGTTPEELENRYREAVLGTANANMPAIFRTDLPPY